MSVSTRIIAVTGLAVFFGVAPAHARSTDARAPGTSSPVPMSIGAPATRTEAAIVVAAKAGKIVRAASRAERTERKEDEQDTPPQNAELPANAEAEPRTPAAVNSAAEEPAAARTGAPVTPAPAVVSAPPAKSAPAANAKLDCLAGCSDVNGAPTAARARASTAQSAVTTPVPETNGVVCVAGCGGDGPKTTAQAVQTQSEVRATSDSKGSNRVTILRGNNRTKVYAVGN